MNRFNDPRYKHAAYNFITFRARLLNAFAGSVSGGLLAKLAAATGLVMEEGLTTLQQTYPVPIPTGGFREAKKPRQFDRWSERSITGGTLPFEAGFAEELKKLTRPGPVATLFNSPNKATQLGQSAQALLDNLLCKRLMAGSSTKHGYDDDFFFKASKKIHPDMPNSPTYGNKHSLTLKKANPIDFVREVNKKCKAVPHPAHSTHAPHWMDQQLAAILCPEDAFDILEDVAVKDELRVTVTSGSATNTVVEVNKWKGKFTPIEARHLASNKAYAFTRGPGAEAGLLVHSLMGIESLPGGDFMASVDWRAETGTWMMPRIWELGPNTEYAIINKEVLIGGDLDVDAILFAPWSVHEIDLTIE
ncbi:MAG: hypothetical protein IPM54_25015 [Polyangiaceae bacterium]|nr:hypothetical protein [Polyangiaceae bacterium]